MKKWFYGLRNTLIYPICKLIGHKWEEKDISMLGHNCEWECKRCKAFIYRADNTCD
jgi:hypothetical protein